MTSFGSISEGTYLAIYSMILLMQSRKILNADYLAMKLFASRHHLTKVLQVLQQHNYLGSTRGPSGGYYLNKEPSEINLLEIYELISGKINTSACAINRKLCPFKLCVFDGKLAEMKIEFRNYLKAKTLDEYEFEN